MLVRANRKREEIYNRSRCIVVTHTHTSRRKERKRERNRFVQFWSWSGTKMKIKRINVSNVQYEQLYKNALFDGKVLFTLELRSKIVL